MHLSYFPHSSSFSLDIKATPIFILIMHQRHTPSRIRPCLFQESTPALPLIHIFSILQINCYIGCYFIITSCYHILGIALYHYSFSIDAYKCANSNHSNARLVNHKDKCPDPDCMHAACSNSIMEQMVS